MDRYIFRQMMDYFLLGMVVFTLVLFFSDAFLDFTRDIQKLGIPLHISLILVGLQLPQTVALILPASTFLAVLIVFNQLNNQFELIAMRMNGISLHRMIAPALVLGVVASAFSYILGDYVVPYCNRQTVLLKNEILSRGMLPFGRTSFTYSDRKDDGQLNKLIYISEYDKRKLSASTIIDLSESDTVRVIFARSGESGLKRWKIRNASTYTLLKQKDTLAASHGDFDIANPLRSSMKSGGEDAAREKLNDELNVDSSLHNFWNLFQRIQKREEIGRYVTKGTYVNLWEKITLPLSSLIIILTAVPLAITPPRSGSNRGFIFSLGIFFLYYILRGIFTKFGENGIFTFGGTIPIEYSLLIGCWLPLAVIGIMGAVLLVRKSRVL